MRLNKADLAKAPAAQADVREHPFLFSAPMVRALLDGTKTQTRRVVSIANSLVNGHPPCRSRNPDILAAWHNLNFSAAWVDNGPSPAGNAGPYLKVPGGDESVHRVYPRVQPGGRLWVRETWGLFDTEPADGSERAHVFYRATDGDRNDLRYQKWRPSIFMPRWASRITLEVTDVRVERVQEISEDDVLAEGVAGIWGTPHVRAYAGLWDRINGKRADCAWEDSPWVWVIAFRRVQP